MACLPQYTGGFPAPEGGHTASPGGRSVVIAMSPNTRNTAETMSRLGRQGSRHPTRWANQEELDGDWPAQAEGSRDPSMAIRATSVRRKRW